MKKVFLSILAISLLAKVNAQETVYPAPPQTGTVVITNATVHVGNGQVLNNANVTITNGKIAAVGTGAVPAGAKTIDATGKHVYPGLILPVSNLGLVDINSIRAGNDVREIGDWNPNVRALAAYNTD